MDVGKIATLIAEVELFRHLPDSTRQEIVRSGRHRYRRRGASIFLQDSPGDSCFVLLEGVVKLYVLYEDGRRVELVRHSKPAVFGEIAVIDGGNRSASAEVVEDARLLELDRETLLGIIRSDDAALDALLRTLGGMVRRTTRQVEELSFLQLRGRVARYLVRLAKEKGVRTGRIDHVHQAEIATIVGGTRESVNTAIGELEKRRCIRRHPGGDIEILDLDKLREQAALESERAE